MKFLLILAFVCLVVQSQANGMNQVETDVEDSIRQKRSSFGNVQNHCEGALCSNNQVEIQRGKRSPFGQIQNVCVGINCCNGYDCPINKVSIDDFSVRNDRSCTYK
uniref:Uncharacterized protein n=1 Tax=Acrobeloides nanus TaxID=290746 RepID=A0A914CJT4_9BILA